MEKLRTIVTVQGFIETIFTILDDEDLTLGGKVARDLLQCLMNVVENATCQKYLRETVTWPCLGTCLALLTKVAQS